MSVNRIWMITDTHFGVRANSMEWFEICKEYHENVFIPLLKENVIEQKSSMLYPRTNA